MTTWRLTIDTTGTTAVRGPRDGMWVVEGVGAPPTIETLAPPAGPSPPPTWVDALAAQPGEDTSSFVFPTDGPRYQTRDFDRNYALGLAPPASDYYACEGDAGNPSIGSHANAGLIAPGGQTDYGGQTPRQVGGLRLWVRVVAGESPLSPAPAPPHLIRRALAKGRLTP